MAGNNGEAKVTFKVFNEDFNRGMKEMEAASKKLRQELKLEQEQLKQNGSESEKLSSVLNSLQKQYEISRQKTQATAQQLEAVKKQFGENSAEAAKMETKLRSAEIAEQQLANRIAKTSQELNQARQAESEAAQASDKRRQALQQLQQEQENLKSSSQRLTSEYNLQKAQMGENASAADKMAAAEAHVRQQADITRQVIANLEKQLSLTEQEYGKNSTEANQMASRLNAAKTSIANLDNELEKIKSSGHNAADGMDELGRKITAGNFMQATEILSGVADKAKEIGKSAIEGATQVADSQQDIQANLGVTGKEAEKLQGVVTRVFENGVTDSMESASKAVQSVKRYMGDLNNTDLEKVTNKVIGIGKHTDTDVNENVRAASQLMNHFGVDADTSLDLIAAGFQKGLNKSDDFLDTLNEYSPQFAQAGFSAKDMLNTISKGMQSGAFNTDKAADAVKEFGIRLKDGTISKNIGLYSKHTQDLFKKFEDGKATSAQVFQSINKDISETDDKTKKYNMGVSAMGTQYEDLGDKAVSAFAKTGDSIGDVTGKANDMSKHAPGENWLSTLRKLRDALAPLGQDIIKNLTPVIEMIGDIAKGFTSIPRPVRIVIEVIGGLITGIVALSPIISALAIALPVVGSVFAAIGSAIAGVVTVLGGPLIAVIAVVIGVIIGIIAVLRNWGGVGDWLKDKWNGFKDWIGNLWQGIKNVTETVWNSIKQFLINWWPVLIGSLFGPIGTIVGFIAKNWDSVKAVTEKVWGAISSWLGGLWQGIVKIASTIWGGLVNVFTFVFLLVKEAISAAWTVISSLLIAAWRIIVALTAPIWKPVAAFFSSLWNGIKNVASSVWNNLKAFFTTTWNAIVSLAKNIFNPIKSFFSAVWNAVKNTSSSIWNGIKSVISKAWGGIKTVVQSAANAVKSIVSAGWNRVKSISSTVWNGVKSVITAVWKAIKSIVSTYINNVKSNVSRVWNSIRSTTSSVWNGTKSAITHVWSGIRSSVSSAANSVRSRVSSVWNSIRSTTSSVWNRIKSAITSPIYSARNTVGRIVSSIKGFFANMHLRIPRISLPPLPHFHLSGHFSLKPPSVPHLSVSWYKNGGIFNDASIIGIGEAGREAALPLVGHAMDPFADAVANRMLSTLPQVAQSQMAQNVTNNNKIVMYNTVRNDKDIDKIAEKVDEVMGGIGNRRAAAWGGANG